jgi:hypothetical protein
MMRGWGFLLALAALCGACSAPLTGATASSSDAIDDPPRRAEVPLVLVAMPDSASFRSVRSTLVDELKKDFDIETVVVDRRMTATELGHRVEQKRPACVVLMDNPTVGLYRAYARNRGRPVAPAVVVMTSFLEELRDNFRNASGVAYEVPGVTAFVNLRAVITRPVNRVGVIHRPAFRRFVERQKALAQKEEITLVPVEVPAEPTAAEVRAALNSLRSVDALWVLNDNVLLRDGAFLDAAWRPELGAMNVPVVVGVSTLVSTEARFGTFAVLPDHEALGVQAANIVFELSENDWRADEFPIELPVSTLTVVNLKQVREKFGLRDGALARIDRALE